MLFSGCTKDSGGGSGSDDSGSGQQTLGAFETDCGTVIKSKVKNPVDPASGIRGKARAVGANLLTLTPTSGGPVLVKLHGLGAPYSDAVQRGALRILDGLTQEDAIFFAAAPDCTTQISTATGTIGQLFTASGKSYSEELIRQGYAAVVNDVCDGSELTQCYSALIEEATAGTAGELEKFLWKPVSDSNGRLAVHSSPSGTAVVVAGETGVNAGGGNGYGSLARFSKPGCAYGGNVTVRVLNEQGLPYRFNGQTSLTIPNGCQRYCIKDGALQVCPKS
jgi:hypothetical protein